MEKEFKGLLLVIIFVVVALICASLYDSAKNRDAAMERVKVLSERR